MAASELNMQHDECTDDETIKGILMMNVPVPMASECVLWSSKNVHLLLSVHSHRLVKSVCLRQHTTV